MDSIRFLRTRVLVLLCYHRLLQHKQDIGLGFAIVAFYGIGGILVPIIIGMVFTVGSFGFQLDTQISCYMLLKKLEVD